MSVERKYKVRLSCGFGTAQVSPDRLRKFPQNLAGNSLAIAISLSNSVGKFCKYLKQSRLPS